MRPVRPCPPSQMRRCSVNARVLLALVLVLGLATSCVSTTIEGSGNIITEAREVAGVTAVALEGVGNLVVRQTGSEALRVTADDNILEYVRTEVRADGTLVIDLDPRAPSVVVRPSATPVFELDVMELDGVAVSGSGSVSADTLRAAEMSLAVSGSGDIRMGALIAGNLAVAISGSGDVVLRGEAASQSVAVSGSGRYSASELATPRAEVSVSGSGDVTIWAAAALDVRISGSGSVGYYGDPSVTSNISGTGRIRQLGVKETTL